MESHGGWTSSQWPTASVVILLFTPWNPDLFFERLFFPACRTPWRGFSGGVTAVVAAADLLLRRQPFEDEVDRGRDLRSGGAVCDAGVLRELAKALHVTCLRDDVVRRRRVAERQRSAKVEPLDDGTCVGALEHPAEDVAHCRSEEHTSELQSLRHLVCRLLLEKKK